MRAHQRIRAKTLVNHWKMEPTSGVEPLTC